MYNDSMKKFIIILFVIFIILSFTPIFTITTYPADAPSETKVGLFRYLLQHTSIGRQSPQGSDDMIELPN